MSTRLQPHRKARMAWSVSCHRYWVRILYGRHRLRQYQDFKFQQRKNCCVRNTRFQVFSKVPPDSKCTMMSRTTVAQVPQGNRKYCFIIGGIPFELAKQVKEKSAIPSWKRHLSILPAKNSARVSIFIKQYMMRWFAKPLSSTGMPILQLDSCLTWDNSLTLPRIWTLPKAGFFSAINWINHDES